jgi:cellulose synthase/poly-beta-1,6-N-acetylglucosamine synthase-like glycosyltransferase/peptidoglycan/xylan/chitin deacetylase (PgdA/CDA1 family)/spore germination protein YaaH
VITSDKQSPVFYDPKARRARLVRAAAAAVAAIAIVFTLGFAASLVIVPQLASPAAHNAAHAAPLPHNHEYLAARANLFRHIARDERRAQRPIVHGSEIAGAYFPPWQDGALQDFREHARSLTHIYPAWIEIGADGRSLITNDWDPAKTPSTEPLMRIARANNVRVVPTISNASHSHFDARRVARMLSGPDGGKAVRDALVNFVVSNQLAGLQLDVEMFGVDQKPRYLEWVHQLAIELRAHGKELSAAVQATEDPDLMRGLARETDYVVAMAYDEHETPNVPASVGSIGFVRDTLRTFSENVPANKLVLGIGAYGYDWAMDGSEPQTVTNQEALALASGYRDSERAEDVVNFDPAALEPNFDYTDEHNIQHEVWFLDAPTVANAETMARAYRTKGAALWALGMEDSSTWRVFGANVAPNPDLRAVTAPSTPEFIGDGELLSVRRSPSAGLRRYETDPQTQLISDEEYLQYPTGWLIARQGAQDHRIAFTFDDGPDPRWTPQILSVLRQEHVPATFFMIGENAVAEPDLVRRVYADGNEIGNHSYTHPNMAHVGEERIRLELAACQRALESIIGRSVRLFRPPFNADADPASFGEIFPVSVAGSAGYVTAGESIDPNDWDLDRPMPDGTVHRVTGADLEASVLSQLDAGHAILLHDGGGDRSATVDAVRRLIPDLRARGYQFVTMGELGNMTRAQTMPQLSVEDQRLAQLDDGIFTFQRIAGAVLFWAFSISIVLGLARIALMLGLAAKRTDRPEKSEDRPRVDVIIAAYNEETVITGTIRAVLAATDVDLGLIVVNDGSTDATAEVVARDFPNEPRLTFLSKANGGKASALNLALEHVTAPIVIGIDADTHIDPDGLAALARRFADPKIAAVAGNVRVGNLQNIVTKWQAIEYITSQNIDRRALARLNAVTVVPGAVGAWRTEALRAVGGYQSDTLAEDMDLTWRLRRADWHIANEPRAIAYTEAPASIGALLKQRFRWTYGTLQCLWKHHDALFKYGWFGSLALPSLWLFQIFAQIIAPFVDFQLVIAIIGRVMAWLSALEHSDVAPPNDSAIWFILGIYVAFLALEFAAAFVAFKMDRADAKLLWLQPLQRFVYRQIMYWVVWRAVFRALAGAGQAWGKLRRTGSMEGRSATAQPAKAKALVPAED